MIARITRLLLLLQAAIACGLFYGLRTAGLVHSVWLAAGLACATVVLARMLITANNFVLAKRYSSPRPPQHRLHFLQVCHLFGQEFFASMVSSSWSMPFRPLAQHTAPDADALPVLLVHGYGCNSGYWRSMSKALLKARISHRALDLEPVCTSIDAYVPQLHAAVAELCRDSGHQQIIIVAHSMGGLAARAFLRVHGAHCVAGLITLGTPHQGTGLANFGIGENSRQMCWYGSRNRGKPSSWLTALAAQETLDLRARMVSMYSLHDNIVSPQTSSHLEHAKNIPFPGIGHVALAGHPAIQARVVEEIRRLSGQS